MIVLPMPGCERLGRLAPELHGGTGAVEVHRFPDGAWVFYRLVSGGEAQALIRQLLDLIDADDSVLARDAERSTELHGVVAARRGGARGDPKARGLVQLSLGHGAPHDSSQPPGFSRRRPLGRRRTPR